ncbi:MAG: hypothetical protein ACYS26_01925 [Planctomycetota bacterium]|jgi:hypothetical protein
MLPVLLACAALAAPQTDTVPPALMASDLTFGTLAPIGVPESNHLGLVIGSTVRFSISGGGIAANGLALLGSAPNLAPSPVPLGVGFLELDPATLKIAAIGSLNAFGQVDFEFPIPAGLDLGHTLSTQAVTIDSNFTVRPTNVLDHEVTDLTPVELDWHSKSNHPMAGTQQALLITNEADWAAYNAVHLGPSYVYPTVDFSKQVVVVGFGGYYLTGGYSVEVTGVKALPGHVLEVQLTHWTPGIGCGTTYSHTSPVQAVVFDRVVWGSSVVTANTTSQKPPCP